MAVGLHSRSNVLIGSFWDVVNDGLIVTQLIVVFKLIIFSGELRVNFLAVELISL
jgi:hypothetical protein